MTKHNIIEVDYGLASAYSDGTIEINRKITGTLRDKLINHELSHTSGGYSIQDFKTDFQSKAPYFFESLKFCLLNWEGFINFMPILYSYYLKKWSINITFLYPFLLYGAIFALASKLLFKVSFFLAFGAWINVIIVLNVLLLFYTHFYTRKVIKSAAISDTIISS
jgi:hypothetical protein